MIPPVLEGLLAEPPMAEAPMAESPMTEGPMAESMLEGLEVIPDIDISASNLNTCLGLLDDARTAMIEGGLEVLNATIQRMYEDDFNVDEPYLFARTNIPRDGEGWDEVIEMAHPFLPQGETLGELTMGRDDLYAAYGPGTQQTALYNYLPAFFNKPGSMFLASWYFDRRQAEEERAYEYADADKKVYIGFLEPYYRFNEQSKETRLDHVQVMCGLN